jgi:hypothetical protein
MGKALWLLVATLLSISAHAKDSTELSQKRRDVLEKTSFYCAIGRNPIEHSEEALKIVPSAQCRFSGPLDTKLDPLVLQTPILNPHLTIQALKEFLTTNGVQVASNNRFQLGNASFTAQERNYKNLTDRLMRLHGFPPEWGDTFVTISANSTQDVDTFVAFVKAHNGDSLFWTNPHFQDELAVLPRRQHALPYSPIELVSKCQPITASPNILLVGDLHDPPQSQYFLTLLQTQKFAWVGLEVDHSQESIYQHFVQTNDESDLSFFVRQFPRNIQDNFKAIFRLLKSQNAKVVFINSADEYFNFPFTNVGTHGLIMAARNRIWASTLPQTWTGTGVILGGLDHFTSYPGSDFQDFAKDRFPNLTLNLIDPTEDCSPKSAQLKRKAP